MNCDERGLKPRDYKRDLGADLISETRERVQVSNTRCRLR
jgi:hypothetical protein